MNEDASKQEVDGGEDACNRLKFGNAAYAIVSFGPCPSLGPSLIHPNETVLLDASGAPERAHGTHGTNGVHTVKAAAAAAAKPHCSHLTENVSSEDSVGGAQTVVAGIWLWLGHVRGSEKVMLRHHATRRSFH